MRRHTMCCLAMCCFVIVGAVTCCHLCCRCCCPCFADCRLPSTLHALVVSLLCIYALCYSGDFFDNGGTSTASSSVGSSGNGSNTSLPVMMRVSQLSYAIVGISAGYFLVDVCVLMWHPEISSTEMLVHHVVALLSLAVAAQVHCMHVYLMMVLLSELTTPFVNVRWWLDRAELKGHKLYTVNGLLLMLVWGVARVVMFLPLYAHVLWNWDSVRQIPPHAIALLLGVPLLLFGLNTLWFIKIVRGAMKLVCKEHTQQGQQQPAQDLLQQQEQQQQLQQAVPGKQELASSAVEVLAYAHHHGE